MGRTGGGIAGYYVGNGKYYNMLFSLQTNPAVKSGGSRQETVEVSGAVHRLGSANRKLARINRGVFCMEARDSVLTNESKTGRTPNLLGMHEKCIRCTDMMLLKR
jgi:hypothetical protein